MGEQRRAQRYDIRLPLQICVSGRQPVEFCTGELRNISRLGLYFLSDASWEPGTVMELTFALPTERERNFSVLVRASAKVLRLSPIAGGVTPRFGVAATIDRLDFVRPVSEGAAA